MIDPATGGPHTAHTTSPVPLIVIESLRAVASDSVGGLTDDLGPDKPGVLVTLDLPEFMSAAEEEDLRRHLVTVVEQIS